MRLIENFKSSKKIKNHIEAVQTGLNIYKNKEIDENLLFLDKKIKEKQYKGIVVYAEAVQWEPIQRPHQFLKELGKKGYLCLFLVHEATEEVKIEEKFLNVYLVNGQRKVMSLLKDKEVIFLITYFMQYIYADYFENKTIWLDIVDRLDFFAYYNSYSKKIWKKLIKNADILTYSADNLKSFIKKRNDALLLPNAASLEDFELSENVIPEDIKKIIDSDKKIIGYFGAIEEWFDFSIIKELSQSGKYEIVLIGKETIKKDYPYVHYLGPKKHQELKKYATHFDIALIPFIVNDLTNNVSPVKFYEYLALNLPVVTTPIYEMRKYKESSVVKILDKKENINKKIEELLELDKEEVKKECQKLLKENTWKKRIEDVEKLLGGM